MIGKLMADSNTEPIKVTGSSSDFYVTSEPPYPRNDVVQSEYSRDRHRICTDPARADQIAGDAKRVIDYSPLRTQESMRGLCKWNDALTRAAKDWLDAEARGAGSESDDGDAGGEPSGMGELDGDSGGDGPGVKREEGDGDGGGGSGPGVKREEESVLVDITYSPPPAGGSSPGPAGAAGGA